MKPENQVSSFEPSKKLKELGVRKKSILAWNPDTKKLTSGYLGVPQPKDHNKFENRISAFTVAELGEMLPAKINYLSYFTIKQKFITHIHAKPEDYFFNYKGKYDTNQASGESKISSILVGSQSKTEADARAKMLIYLIENNLIKL